MARALKTVVLIVSLTVLHPAAGYCQSIRMSYTGTPGFMTPFWIVQEAGLLKKQALRGEQIMVIGDGIPVAMLR
jgi:hypothetical protein